MPYRIRQCYLPPSRRDINVANPKCHCTSITTALGMSLRAAKIEYHSSESSLMIRTANILVIKIQLLAFPSADPSLQRHNVKKICR